MPVPEQTPVDSSTGNGVTTVFAYTFKILDEDDILVEVDGVAQVLSVDYTVSGVGVDGGGDVTFLVAPENGTTVVRSRNMAFARTEQDYQEGGGFEADTVDEDFDRLVMMLQQVALSVRQAFKAPSSVSADQVLTDEMWAARASMLLGFDSQGDFGVFAALDQALVSVFMQALLDDADAAAARATLGSSAVGDAVFVAANAAAGRAALDLNEGLSTGTIIRRNAIINGDFGVAQLGTSFAAAAHNDYTLDCWKYIKIATAAVHTISQSTDVPTVAQAGRLHTHSLLIDCTTVDAAIAAGDVCGIVQLIEGYNFKPLAQRAFTLSFWVKATKTGTYCAAFYNSSGDRSYVAEYTVDAADTWEFKTITVSASPSAGTWDYANGIGLGVFFTLNCGTTFQTTPGAWQAGNFRGTASQVNATDDAANNLRICGVQLEAGSVATEFEQRSRQQEVALCQRYINKTYDEGTAPGTVTANGAMALQAAGTAAGNACGYRQFPVSMRAAPTLTFYSPNDGATGNGYRTTGGANVAVSQAGLTASQAGSIVTNAAAVTDAEFITVHVVAKATL
jgi:hypothetical protein